MLDYLPEGGDESAHLLPRDIRSNDLRARIPAQSLIEKLVELEHRGERGEQESWHRGAVGERYVADLLKGLGPEWTVLHSVPVGKDGSDIDHVLIGPPGVFTINTKHHPGKSVWVAGRALRVDNQPKHYLTHAIHEADRAQRLLSKATGFTVEVVGIIVIVSATLTIRERPHSDGAQIGVVRAADLLSTVQVPRGYNDEQVAKIVDAAIRPETWSPVKPRAVSDPAALLAQFAAIDARMRTRTRMPRPATNAPRPRPSTPGPSTRDSCLGAFVKFLGILALIAAALWALTIGLPMLLSAAATSAQTQQGERAEEARQAEFTALAQAAGTAAIALDANSPGGVRPTKLKITPLGSRLVIADTEVFLADLPAGTTGDYTTTPDGLSYTLTLVGPKYGTTVTVSPETGVVAG
ncbi:NERD domain-containing protein [Agromyces protaetiae]|uniref:NERD domain-containing protein n=1 Tax=Agromyces protaetiae TaxID=2509455 RepID=A0A4P6F7J3_9MICO|nr:nuclease-related domain-containing protein [Agromyces protaetiae]QAY72030.1 NERD domain-containing protein [Agromyces protaetiae]